MKSPSVFLLGLAYGFAFGMAARGLIDYAEAVATHAVRPTIRRLHP